jgi:hypothetical protein
VAADGMVRTSSAGQKSRNLSINIKKKWYFFPKAATAFTKKVLLHFFKMLNEMNLPIREHLGL